ncbi:Alpha/Beta hydrolase protein [Aspergillus cavernicola]|uniref:Alpha/Beta hydrolase protein n=1 Tax=Aspergillus cavernicola TaxID=176166 RepID=A0ABR4HZ90_9EURO
MASSYSQTIEALSISLTNHRSHYTLVAAAGISLSVSLIIRALFSNRRMEGRVLNSPLAAMQSPNTNNNEHPLPLDVLPGARDVQTPYGSIRVYEWGPEDGSKVLLVHGITTPCISLGGVAHALVDRGCRVMLFDLFGRGYSDCPSDLPQDDRLFASQIFLALGSSPISWTGAGSGRFCLVGYSLGGGIAASFASFFPQLLTALVLLAPAGLIRDSHISFRTRFLYSGGLPGRLLTYLSGKRLRAGPLSTPKSQHKKFHTRDALTEEIPSQTGTEAQILSRSYPNVTVPAAVLWQVNNHDGFVHAFVSSMRYGPILAQRQRECWERLGRYLTEQKKLPAPVQKLNGLPSDKVIIMCGVTDSIIIQDELSTDANATLGNDVIFKYFSAGHEFPSTRYDEVAQIVSDTLLSNA